jgi:protein SCO1/2
MNTPTDLAPADERKALPVPPSILWGLLVLFLLGIAGAWIWKGYREHTAAPTPLPVYGAVKAFTLVERSGQPFGLADLKGHVFIINFFFSRCTEICPLTMPQMARLQAALADDVRLVSITVDPEHDTTAILSELAERFNAQPNRWYFLTGDQQAIYDLSLNTFHMAVGEVPDSEHKHRGNAFLHGGHFALVDRQGQIRGYYDGLDDEAMSRLLQEVRLLLQEKSES